MTIGQVARLASVGVETIRFYEREGLLPKPQRRPSGYRVFSPDVVARIQFIKKAKQLGFSLKEIRDLLSLRVDSRATKADVKKFVDAKIEEVDERLRDLKRMRGALVHLSNACAGKGPVGDFPLLVALEATQIKDLSA
jgi:MerR family transcriptional regulator, copper efflux regulator